MATSKFERRFTNNTGEPLLGATVEIVPQSKTYPEGKITLIEHPTRKGWYYKDGVPLGEYKIYINGALYTQNIFHSENILYHIAILFDDNLVFLGQLEPERLNLPTTPPAQNKKGNMYFEESSRTIKVDIDGTGNYVSVGGGGGGGSQTTGVVLISGNQTITGIKTFFNIDMSPVPGSSLALPLTPPNTSNGRRTGAIYYDSANNVLKISKDGSGTNFLILGSSEGEDWVSLHGLSVHDGQLQGKGVYVFKDGNVVALPLRNSQNGYYAEDAPGAIYIDETNKRILVNFGQSHYEEDGAVNEEYFVILAREEMLEEVRNDSKILTGDAGQTRELHGLIEMIGDGRIDGTEGVIQLPDKDFSPEVDGFWNALYTDTSYQDETNTRRYRLKIKFRNPQPPYQLVEKTFISADEIKTWIDSGAGQFSGTATQCIVTVPGGTSNDRYYVTPIGTSWNVNDMLMVAAGEGQFTVTRGSGGTNNLQFNWFRRKAGSF